MKHPLIGRIGTLKNLHESLNGAKVRVVGVTDRGGLQVKTLQAVGPYRDGERLTVKVYEFEPAN